MTALRKAVKLTIRQVARRTGRPSGTLGDYFSGQHLPPATQPEVLNDILKACGVTDAMTLLEWQRALERARTPDNGLVPYRGLEVFQPEDADLFFGRERLTCALVGKLASRYRRGGLLVVTGVSGSGKSSLLRAGLIPALRRGDLGIPGSRNWPLLLFTPGDRPLTELASQLATATQITPRDAEKILRSNPQAATDLARRVRSAADASETPAESDAAGPGFPTRLVVVVDQFEEVFTSCSDEAERSAFIAALTAAGGGSPVEPSDTAPEGDCSPAALVVLALRADFYSQALRHADLLSALQGGQVEVVGPMTEDELRDVIVKPAETARVDIEDGLVELLLRDLRPAAGNGTAKEQVGREGGRGAAPPAHEAGALPLLSHALRVTWEHRQRGRMTVAEYKASGLIQGAVTQTAEEAYGNLTETQRKTARQLFLRLVRIADDTADTRRRVSRAELLDSYGHDRSAEFAAVLCQFVNRWLITVDRDRRKDRDQVVEIAHDSLLSAWPRLRDWIDDDRAGLVIAQRLIDDARTWETERRDPGRLYRGNQLAIADEWARAVDRPREDLPQFAREFLDASLAARRRWARIRTAAAAVMAVLLAFSATAALVAYHQRQEALDLQRIATSDSLIATANLTRSGNPELALELGLAAHRLNPTGETTASLVTTLTREVGFVSADRAGPRTDTFYTVAFSPDGRTLATGSFDRTVTLWDVTDPAAPSFLVALDGHGDSVVAVAFSPDGRTLVSGSDDQTAILWDIADRSHPTRLATLAGHEKPVLAVAFTPDSRILATGSGDGTVTLWNMSTDRHATLLATVGQVGDSGVRAAAFSPDGATMATGDFDGRLILWDLADQARPAQKAVAPTRHEGTIFAVAFSPDGRTLATGSGDRTVILWDLADPARPFREAARLTNHTGSVVSVAFSSRAPETASSGGFEAARQILATGSFDSTVALWDVTDPAHPALLATVAGHAEAVRSVAFSPDGNAFATGGSDRRVLLWDVGRLHQLGEHAVQEACASTGGEGLDREEWAEYVPNIDYEASCP